MKTKLIQLLMLSFIAFSLFTFVSIMGDFSLQPSRNYGINAAYAQGEKHRGPNPLPGPQRKLGPNPPISSVPEPSTLILLGSGLVVGGGIYTVIRYRKRNKK